MREVVEINMSEDRKEEIKQEVQRRLNLWLENSSFDEMTVSGSFVRFDMGIGLIGPGVQPEEWMGKKDDFGEFVSMDEFYSTEYKSILNDAFLEELNKDVK